MSFSMDDLKRLPSVSRIHFVECQANGAPMGHENGNENMGLPVQYVWGMTSCSEWSGVPLSVLLNEAGVQAGASWVVSEGAEAGKWSHTIPLEKAMDDVIGFMVGRSDNLTVFMLLDVMTTAKVNTLADARAADPGL